MAAGRGAAAAVLALVGVLLGAGCNSVLGIEQRAARGSGLIPCDATSIEESCGVSSTGKPMTCFPERQLGGQDFCVEACDGDPASSDDTTECLSSGARLLRCSPTPVKPDPLPPCPTGLHCYRTDLLDNVGLCMSVPICSSDADCTDGTHASCAGTLVSELSQGNVNPDHLFCLKKDCKSALSSCPPTESCMPSQYFAGGALGDICVPNCDGNNRCPANFSCAKGPYAPTALPLCLPGVPGTQCSHDEDCMLGQCIDTGEGFGVCSIPCSSDLVCQFLNINTSSDVFICINQHCITPHSFYGANCQSPADCPSGQRCFPYFPYQADPNMNPGHDDCRVPCDADGKCAPRGGIPHACLAAHAGGCFPGEFGIPCTSSADCIPDLVCEPVLVEDRQWSRGDESICTLPCSSDCESSPWTRGKAFCRDGLCLMRAQANDACTSDDQCVSSYCVVLSGGSGTCAAFPRP
jgi:hypothetical protein